MEASDDQRHLSIILTLVLPMPIDGQNVGLIPVGKLYYDIDRDSAINFAEQLKKDAEELKPPSKLQVASDVGAVEQAAQNIDKMRRG